jgi:hypothetical protein
MDAKKYHELTWVNVSFQVKNQGQNLLRLRTKWDDYKHYETSS